MLRAALIDILKRCEDEAPDLVPDLRAALRLADQLMQRTISLSSGGGSTFAGDDEPVTDEATAEQRAPPIERYEDLGLIATGGMGEVRRVRDHRLNRLVAMKVVRPDLSERGLVQSRFVKEAQATSQLQHPGIVPVYDGGSLADGRAYFTMKEVRGHTFTRAIRDVHRGRGREPVRAGSIRRLVTILHLASQAIAFAHARGVVHRDLKPDNVMVGDFGEVQVMDWGLAKLLGEDAWSPGDGDPVVTARDLAARTRDGAVSGTPSYMAPEQARGEVRRIDPRTDVYALGAILYEVLAGHPPFLGPSGEEVLEQVRLGPPPAPLAAEADHPLEPLVRACERAMARVQEDRYPSATAFAADLQAWLDGSRQRARALEVVARAERAAPEVAALRERAAALRARAAELLDAVPVWAPEDQKAPGWALGDEAEALARRASLRAVEREQLLTAALTHAPDLLEAHAALAQTHLERHAAAAAVADGEAQAKAEVLIRAHYQALPEEHPVRAACATYLRGDGALSLRTDPPGAEVLLQRLESHHRRLRVVEERHLGATPLDAVPLPMGSYVCRLRHSGHADVRYPVSIERGRHWDGVRPGGSEPFGVWLPREGELGPDDCYVPAGWCTVGMAGAFGALPPGTRVWCDGFAIGRFPVTNGAFLAFLNDLIARGEEEEALRRVPRERGGTAGEQGSIVYGRTATGAFELRPDADGDMWRPDHPTLLVDWAGAMAYAAWEAERTSLPWRLPWDLEWEKAARGVDARPYPWGWGLDPSFACYRESHRGRPMPQVVDSFPADVSPYGVRGLGGNVMDWCVDQWTKAGPSPLPVVVGPHDPQGLGARVRRVRRGGAWNGAPGVVRSASRVDADPALRGPNQGFRLARPLG